MPRCLRRPAGARRTRKLNSSFTHHPRGQQPLRRHPRWGQAESQEIAPTETRDPGLGPLPLLRTLSRIHLTTKWRRRTLQSKAESQLYRDSESL